MKITKLIWTVLFFMMGYIYTEAHPVRKNIDLNRGEQLFNMICHPATLPISFTYCGKDYKNLGSLKEISRNITSTPTGKIAELTFALDENLHIYVQASICNEFGEVEYTVWFKNISTSTTSGVIENLKSANIQFKGNNPVLAGCLGDHSNFYATYVKDLKQEHINFRSNSGRATHVYFPYFNLLHGNGGTLIALGWAGTWESNFSTKGAQTTWTAQNCNDLQTVLLPGESIRTALVVLLPYKGRNTDEASNLWREWFIKYNMPKANKQGDPILPFTTSSFAGDTGLPNSDGSISEHFFTWKRTLERLVYENVKPDYRWFDAGWYFDPSGKTTIKDWWGTVGSWELDTIKWPKKTFLESNEACHKEGIKVLVWFEPERTTNINELVKNYGYKSEWAIYARRNYYHNNIGNPECLAWTIQRITKMMKENSVDLYREDNNSDWIGAWIRGDSIEYSKTHLTRKGITENKSIQGHYALWDAIIDFCAKNNKSTFIDNCASGGGRNDIESLRRSIPFLRSDADRTTTALRLSMSSTFNKWIPYCGSSTKESNVQLDEGQEGGSTSYVSRASWLPIYNFSGRYTHDITFDYDNMRKNIREWRKYNHLITKDFYVLTPWHNQTETNQWTVFVYRDSYTEEGVIQAFRQETCGEEKYIAKLPFVNPISNYKLTNEDTGEVLLLKGNELQKKGLTIYLDQPKSSAIWHIQKQD